VEAFLDGALPFTDIPRVVEHVLGNVAIATVATLDDIFAADATARAVARERIARTRLQRTAAE
jgi:1-deoxy-D-xylulose-5-phosphate reductoisomerase